MRASAGYGRHLTRAICGCCRNATEPGARLQRLVPHEGWNALRSADHHDAYSRFLLCCQIAVKADTVHVEALFDAAFREYGLPEVITRITGRPLPAGLREPEPLIDAMGSARHCGGTEPACFPQDNGRHERMHRTLKQTR